MKNNLLKIGFAEVAAIGTWLMIMGISLNWMLTSAPQHISQYAVHVIFLFILYFVCFLSISQEWISRSKLRLIYFLLGLQLLSAISIMLIIPISFLPILSIIWVAILPHFFSMTKSILIMIGIVILWFSLYTLRWQAEDIIYSAMLWGSFHFFSLIMTHQTILSKRATLKAEQLNKELVAAQHLLEKATRQNERTRIARDLHDLVGHHLTALSINLQVARHLSEGEAKEKIEQCHSLSKLLLSDVREAVSTMRDNQHLELKEMVDLMLANIPDLIIHNKIDIDLNLDDLNLAKTLLSIIQEAMTNCLKHSGASEFWIEMTDKDDKIILNLYDNGQLKQSYIQGNGLLGMQERIKELEGNFKIDTDEQSMHIKISIPFHTHTVDEYHDH